jgi:hypothetical protein
VATGVIEQKPPILFDLKEIASILIKNQGIHEGLWEVSLEVQATIGQLGPSQESRLPGALILVSKIGLSKAEKAGLNTVDAAEVNPKVSISQRKPER